MNKIYLISLLAIIPIFLLDNTFTEEHVTNIPLKDMYIVDMETKKIADTISWVETRNNDNAKGASGELGKYQTMPSTYRALTKKHLGEVKSFSTTTQEIVVLKEIEELRSKKLSVYQIGLYWNSGSYIKPCKSGVNKWGVFYDSCAYAKNIVKTYNSLDK